MLPVTIEAILLGASPIGNISYLCKLPNFDWIINIWQRKKRKLHWKKKDIQTEWKITE